MKNLVFFLFLSGVGITAAHAQLGADNSAEAQQNLQQLLHLSPLSPGARAFDNRYGGVKGTPYLFEDWRKGSVLIRNNKEPTEPVPVNLNQSENLLLVQVAGNQVGRISADQIESVAFSSGNRVFKTFALATTEGRSGTSRRFYEVLYEGAFILLKDHQKILQEANYKGAYSADRRYDQFLDQTRYFVRAPEETQFEKIKALKRNKLEKALPAYKEQIRSLAREKRWRLNSEAEVIDLLRTLGQREK